MMLKLWSVALIAVTSSVLFEQNTVMAVPLETLMPVPVNGFAEIGVKT